MSFEQVKASCTQISSEPMAEIQHLFETAKRFIEK
jgi:hypothetical protein